MKCLTELVFTKEVFNKLKSFSMAQQELSQELLAGKPLGICRITTYVDPKFVFKNLDLTYENGKNTTRTVTILTSERLKGTMLSLNKNEEEVT